MILLVNQRYSESKKIRHVNYAYTEKTQKTSKDQKSRLIKKVKKNNKYMVGNFQQQESSRILSERHCSHIGKKTSTSYVPNCAIICSRNRLV